LDKSHNPNFFYHDGHSEHHLVGVEEGDREEDDEAGQEVVALTSLKKIVFPPSSELDPK
jgi:hypothetical protein